MTPNKLDELAQRIIASILFLVFMAAMIPLGYILVAKIVNYVGP